MKLDHKVDCFECDFCGEHACTNTDVIETPEGNIACEQCQCDACANFGQDRDNIRQTRILGRLVERWANE